MDEPKKAQDLHGAPTPAPERAETQPTDGQKIDVVTTPAPQEGAQPAPVEPQQALNEGVHQDEAHPEQDHQPQDMHPEADHPELTDQHAHQSHHTEHHGGGSNAAIAATVIIVIALAALATYAYLKTQSGNTTGL